MEDVVRVYIKGAAEFLNVLEPLVLMVTSNQWLMTNSIISSPISSLKNSPQRDIEFLLLRTRI
jgi:hypothetical protein